MSVAALIRDMIAEGATPQLILIAVEAIEARDAVAAEARAKAAERKRRQRERDQSVTVTGQSQDKTQNTPFPAPPNENNLTPPTHTPVYNTPRARRLPADWVPAPLPSQLLDQVLAWKAGLLESELAKFRDWAASAPDKTGLKKDWDAAWRNWLRRKIEEGPKNGNSGNRQDDGMGRTERAAIQALRELGGDPRPAMRSAGSHAVTRQEPYSLLAIGHVGGGSD